MKALILACALLPALLAMASAADASGPRAGASRPNILFLFADDQRADTIAALGNPVIRTPHIDRLVRTGVSFKIGRAHV